MIALVQRVHSASVTAGTQESHIGPGLVALIGIADTDTEVDTQKIFKKLTGLRVMADANDKMNHSLSEVGGELLLVSQFTLISDTKKGYRPSFIHAAQPSLAKDLFDNLYALCQDSGLKTKTGFFGQYMRLKLDCDGPVTIILDSKIL